VIVLDAHEEGGFLLVGLRLHVGAVTFEEVEHVGVAVEGCEVESSEAVRVGVVEPSAQLSLEGRSVLVSAVVSLVVLDVDAQL
jgi:hypothetical protein